MSKLKDLTGQRFGSLVVLERYPQNTKDGHAQWKCLCDCGNEAIYAGRTLTSNKAISCGCARKKDLTGKQFGRLTVIKYAYSKNGARYWECQCECGKTTFVNSSSLTTGNTRSCGCLHSDILKKNNIKLKSKINQDEIIGKRFDYLEVIEPVQNDGASIYRCYCHNCGSYKNIKYSDLIKGRTHACGCILSWAEAQLKSLFNQYDIEYIPQFTFNDLRSEKDVLLRFDFAILKDNQLYCLIEYQGEQHFDKQNPYWTPLLESHDKIKRDYCDKHNLKLVELTKDNDLNKFVDQLKKEINIW